MNKSILIVETPKSCGDCRYCDYIEPIKTSICTADPTMMFKMNDEGSIYSILVDERCPLKPLPEKKEHSEENNPCSDNYEDEYEYQYREGYNTCLCEIVGKTE